MIEEKYKIKTRATNTILIFTVLKFTCYDCVFLPKHSSTIYVYICIYIIYIYIAGCTLESKLKNVSVGLDVDLTLFRRQAIAETSDDIDYRRIYASPELNLYCPTLWQ